MNYVLLLKALSSINSEEDAEMALQLSSSLAQALLAYRIKNVPPVSCLSPVNHVTVTQYSCDTISAGQPSE